MFFWRTFAEELIQKAMREGQFDNLEGAGKPLTFEDDSMIPEDLRMAYKILKNSGHTPPEVQEEKEIQNLVDMLEHCEDEQERYRQIQKLNYLITKWNMKRNRPIQLEKSQKYYQRVVEKVDIQKKNKKER